MGVILLQSRFKKFLLTYKKLHCDGEPYKFFATQRHIQPDTFIKRQAVKPLAVSSGIWVKSGGRVVDTPISILVFKRNIIGAEDNF